VEWSVKARAQAAAASGPPGVGLRGVYLALQAEPGARPPDERSRPLTKTVVGGITALGACRAGTSAWLRFVYAGWGAVRCEGAHGRGGVGSCSGCDRPSAADQQRWSAAGGRDQLADWLRKVGSSKSGTEVTVHGIGGQIEDPGVDVERGSSSGRRRKKTRAVGERTGCA